MQTLISILDENATAKNVRNFLRKTYPKVCMTMGKPVTYIKATVYNGMPKASSFGNAKEDEIVERLDNEAIIRWTQEAFRMTQTYDPQKGKLLYDSYIRKVPREYTADSINYSGRRLQDMLQVACCQFAGFLYDASGKKYDLRVWENE